MMTIRGTIAAAALALIAASPVHAQEPAPTPYLYVIRYDHWTDADERGFGEFITAIGQSDCRTVNDCLHGPGNPFRGSDPAWIYYHFDCADLPYALRAYYAWKRGLPFSYESAVEPRGYARDIRYTASGNIVTERRDVLSETMSGFGLMEEMRDTISSATYRIHPELDGPLPPDFYSPALTPKSIRPGTLIYDPNGHVGTVFRVDPDGRINFIDAHPDNSLTRGFYDERFVRARPSMGAGFKNWRPLRLESASRRGDGALIGGHMVLAPNAAIPDFSVEQFFGNGPRPPAEGDWGTGAFMLYGEALGYYDYVRARLAGGKLEFDPLKEIGDLVASNCADLQYRADAVDLAIAAGMQRRSEPERLPLNIYGADGDWETYSSPSRDARLKTAFKELRDEAERFLRMYQNGDPKLIYSGKDLVGDLIAVYDRQASACKLAYKRSDGSQVAFSYEAARRRLFLMSFDPYHCVERRWGATDPRELATCTDDADKRGWYKAEQNLRNQIDRDYEAEMDFTRAELAVPGPGKGVATPPDTDVRAYLLSMRKPRPIRESARTN